MNTLTVFENAGLRTLKVKKNTFFEIKTSMDRLSVLALKLTSGSKGFSYYKINPGLEHIWRHAGCEAKSPRSLPFLK